MRLFEPDRRVNRQRVGEHRDQAEGRSDHEKFEGFFERDWVIGLRGRGLMSAQVNEGGHLPE